MYNKFRLNDRRHCALRRVQYCLVFLRPIGLATILGVRTKGSSSAQCV